MTVSFKFFEGRAINPNPEDVQRAMGQAFENANIQDCVHPGAESDDEEQESSSTDTKGKGKTDELKEKREEKQKTYSFRWSTFPAEPIDEDELVQFPNEIIDHTFEFAEPKLANVVPRLKHRFATRSDKNHAMPLSYEAEDMRPDSALLPIEAFLGDFKTVDPRYLNFTASRRVGEAKNKDLAAGAELVQRPVFMHAGRSGTEGLELILVDGHGCIEFIWILLGLILAEDVDFGQIQALSLTETGVEEAGRKSSS